MRNISIKGAAEESMYLLEYEKQKILTCAKSFEELAKVFVYLPGSGQSREENGETEEKNRQNILFRKRLMENRELFADNLLEMAGIMGEVAGSDVHAIRFPEKKKKQMIHILEEEGLLVQDMYRLENESEKDCFAICVKCRKNIQCTSEELAGYLSVLLDRHLQAVYGSPFFIPQEYQTIYFEEEAKLSVLSGYARAVKETETVSGDNYSSDSAKEREANEFAQNMLIDKKLWDTMMNSGPIPGIRLGNIIERLKSLSKENKLDFNIVVWRWKYESHIYQLKRTKPIPIQ